MKKDELNIIGDNNICIEGNGNNVVHNINPRIIKKNIITPTHEMLTPSQKKEIKEKIAELAKIDIDSGVSNKTAFSKWYKKLYNKFKVSSYAEIYQNDFDSAIKFLNQQKAMFLKGKLKKTDKEGWRKSNYRSINARLDQFGYDKTFAYEVAHRQTGKTITSLKDLNDTELKKLYGYIMNLKS